MTEQSVQHLVQKFLRNECTPGEKAELASWIAQSANDFTLSKLLEEAWKEYTPQARMPEDKAAAVLAGILHKEKESEPAIAPVRHLWWKRVAVAAVITIMAGTVSYLFMHTNTPVHTIAKIAQAQPSLNNDAYPGKKKAVLTLSDGSTIALDTSLQGTITRQGNTQVISRGGELIYNITDGNSLTTLYNTLNTQRGELFPLNLSDGSKVWLNSASSIRYPVAFNGLERIVEVTGEAYFEVAKNPAKPFKVKLNGMQIEVLGTHFNINGYADESNVKTTLIEGSLKVTKGNAGVLLTPGQEARLKANGKLELIKNADTEEAVSWKNGYFHFSNASLETVMRQFSRWYDVDIEYESKKPEQSFDGDIEKSMNLSQALIILEKSQVHCKISGKKLIVLP